MDLLKFPSGMVPTEAALTENPDFTQHGQKKKKSHRRLPAFGFRLMLGLYYMHFKKFINKPLCAKHGVAFMEK